MNDFLSFLSGLTMQMVFLLSLGYVAYAICQRWISGSSVGIRWCATCIVFCWLLSILFSILVSAHMFAPLPATAVAVIALVLTSRGRLKPMACVPFPRKRLVALPRDHHTERQLHGGARSPS